MSAKLRRRETFIYLRDVKMRRKRLEFWTNITSVGTIDVDRIVARAVEAEKSGWDGAALVDSQCLQPDVYMRLALCAHATTRLKFATGVSNPITRHPSVTAGAMATLQLISGGRAVLGIGRGDSSLAFIGASPMPPASFERYLNMIQAYLRGDEVPLKDAASALVGAETGFDKLALATAPTGSKLNWLPRDLAKVPMEVIATGPKIMAISARSAEYVTFSVGGDIERLKWAIRETRHAAERADRDPESIEFGAFLICFPTENLVSARTNIKGTVAALSRFAIMNKKIVGPVTEHERRTLEKIASVYDMNAHASDGTHTDVLDAEYIDKFAIVGPPAECIERIHEIVELGIKRFGLVTPLYGEESGNESYAMTTGVVIPALRKL
jgi:5,10-methylenetetrahydromethanopterin reductase